VPYVPPVAVKGKLKYLSSQFSLKHALTFYFEAASWVKTTILLLLTRKSVKYFVGQRIQFGYCDAFIT
jgi:hypothetical protein